jgi:hypothetical protein
MVAVGDQEPKREAAMAMPRYPTRPAQPQDRQNIRLGHHPGGEADKYYAPESSRTQSTSRPMQAPSTVLGKSPDKMTVPNTVLDTTDPSVSSKPPPRSLAGSGISNESDEFLFPFGGGRVRYGGGKTHCSRIHPLAAINDNSDITTDMSEDGNNPALSPLTDLDSDSDEYQDVPEAQAANHRIPLSGGSSVEEHEDNLFGIRMPRLASHRQVLSISSLGGWSGTDDDTNSIEMAQPAIHWSPLSGRSSEGMEESGVDLVGIVMVSNSPADTGAEADNIQPSKRRMALSDCSSDDETAADIDLGNITIAQLEGRQRTLSNCFSVGSVVSDDDNMSVGSSGSENLGDEVQSIMLGRWWDHTRPPSVCSSTSDESVGSVLLDTDTSQDIIVSTQPGAQRFPVVVEATTCPSLTAEICNASDPESEIESIVAPRAWLSGLPQPSLPVGIPRTDSAYHHSSHAGAFVESPGEMDIYPWCPIP